MMKVTLPPGWRWSKDVKPLVKTESCQAPHLGYVLSGRLHVVMDDGTEENFGPGDVEMIPPGHDAWVVGNEPTEQIARGEGIPDDEVWRRLKHGSLPR